jgi:hypothetical protein
MNLGRAVIAVSAAYLITGLIYLRRKLAETNPLRVPFSVMQYRTDGRASRLVAVGISWLLGTIINREFAYWPIFAILAAIGLYLSSSMRP